MKNSYRFWLMLLSIDAYLKCFDEKIDIICILCINRIMLENKCPIELKGLDQNKINNFDSFLLEEYINGNIYILIVALNEYRKNEHTNLSNKDILTGKQRKKIEEIKKTLGVINYD